MLLRGRRTLPLILATRARFQLPCGSPACSPFPPSSPSLEGLFQGCDWPAMLRMRACSSGRRCTACSDWLLDKQLLWSRTCDPAPCSMAAYCHGWLVVFFPVSIRFGDKLQAPVGAGEKGRDANQFKLNHAWKSMPRCRRDGNKGCYRQWL